MNNYTVLHLHSDLSNGVTNIDSVTKFDEYILRAEELNMKAIAFTEHGSVFEWVKKKETCEKHGLKYIHACEFYLTETINEKIRDNYHICLFAKNWNGVKEINKLLSIANNRKDGHFYFVPRITLEELYNTSDNIIISTACLGNIFKTENKELLKEFISFLIKNKDRCFLELQHHNIDAQRNLNKKLLLLSKKYGIKYIITTDTHALNETHLKGREILQRSKNIHFDDEENWDLTFKSYDELVMSMKKQGVLTDEEINVGLENTNLLADMIEEFELDRSKKYPKLFNDSLAELKKRINNGVIKRGINKLKNYKTEYIPKIYYELETYIHNDAIDFLLLDTTIKEEMRNRGIECGYSRGSVSGSLIAYLLGMTDVDPIKFNLNFERFMNKERVSLADVDTDWSPKEREVVRDYVFNMDGVYCCDIITFNTIALKGAVKDVARALGYSVDIANSITKEIDANEELMRNKYSDIFEYVDIVNGTIVSIGTHPCGMVVSPIPLDENMGLCSLSTTNKPVSMINMKEIDGLNFVKLDILGLDNIEIINETCKLANIERLVPDNIIDDEKVWKDIRDNTTFIFQWESENAQNYLQQLLSDETVEKIKENNKDFKYIDLMSVGNGAIRPAGASYRNELAKGLYRDNGHESLNEMLAPTLGYLVYQEQIIEFLNKFCGFTMGEADIVRRGFAKKTGTEQFIPRIKDGFIKTMKEKYNVYEEESEKLVVNFLKVIEDASSYLFSLNHSLPYSYIGYACGYLRYYYPLEFITCSLNNVMYKNTDTVDEKTDKIIKYGLDKGIKFSDFRFRYSRATYSCDKENNTIYKGLKSIKFCNEKMAEELYDLKDFEGDFVDLLKIITEDTSCNSRQLKILISLDYFKEFGFSKYLLSVYELFSKRYKKTLKDSTKVKRIEEIKETIKEYENEDLSIQEKIYAELEFLGYCTLQDESFKQTVGAITDISDKFSTRWISIYFLKTGDTQKFKIKYSMIQELELQVGDIVNIKEVKERAKSILVDGQWSADMSQMERHITNIKKVRI